MDIKDIDQYKIKIDAFLSGEMDHDGIASMIANIKDVDIKKELRSYIDLKTNIRIEGEKELKKKYLELFKDQDSVPTIPLNSSSGKVASKSKTFSLSMLTKIAATLLILISGYLFFDTSTSPSSNPTDIFADPPISLMRTADDDSFSQNWEMAMKTFQQQDYKTALSHILAVDIEADELQKYKGKISLYKGICEMRLGNYNTALETWNNIDTQNPYHDQKLWYEAILFIEAEDHVKAKNQLEEIINLESHYKQAEAEELLKSFE